MNRKSEVKAIITEAINNMTDEEDEEEDEEAEAGSNHEKNDDDDNVDWFNPSYWRTRKIQFYFIIQHGKIHIQGFLAAICVCKNCVVTLPD